MYQQREQLWHKAHRGCQVIGQENIGPSDVKLTIRLATGETQDIFADVLEIEDLPLATATFDFGVYRTHSDMLGEDIYAMAWATYRPGK